MKKSKVYWDELEIGSRPCKADPVAHNFKTSEAAQAEAILFANQLNRIFGVKKNTKFVVKVCKINFNNQISYLASVFAVYNANDWDANAYVFHVEDNLPDYWDEISSHDLKSISNS